MDLMKELESAAARGVEVTILTNDRTSPPFTLNWNFYTTRDSGWGEFEGGGFKAVVRDCDGDRTVWDVKHRGRLIAKGECDDYSPVYHFDACVIAAEAAIRAEVIRLRNCIQ